MRLRPMCWIVLALLGATVEAQITEQRPIDTRTSLIQPGSEPRLLLRYKFVPGQFVRYEMRTTMTVLTQHGQAQLKAANETQLWRHYRVISADDAGSAVLEPVVDRVRMSAQTDTLAPVTYDSQLDAEPPRDFAEVARSVGRPFGRFHYSSTGELLKITVLPDAPPHLQAAGDNPDPVWSFLIPLPEEPVGTGAIWRDRFQVPVIVGEGLQQKVTLQRQFTLTNLIDGVAHIEFRTSVLNVINNPQVEGQLLQRTPSGTIVFDPNQGVIVTQTSRVDQTAINALGPNTRLHARSESTERLLSPASAAYQPSNDSR
ncbi:MAG: hypothetical protein KatS3mg113_0896 [Planctomycetaceae bacterium]|nr:MAG: hypothetical protein KatS3mg113_0896 [Planctomycetaceae bacterium]